LAVVGIAFCIFASIATKGLRRRYAEISEAAFPPEERAVKEQKKQERLEKARKCRYFNDGDWRWNSESCSLMPDRDPFCLTAVVMEEGKSRDLDADDCIVFKPKQDEP